jgi:hypothetical protein
MVKDVYTGCDPYLMLNTQFDYFIPELRPFSISFIETSPDFVNASP